jgi:hypothetical protein
MIQSGPNPTSSPTVPSEQQPGDPAHRQYEQRSPANSPSTKMAEHLENGGCTIILGGLSDDRVFAGVEISARRRS